MKEKLFFTKNFVYWPNKRSKPEKAASVQWNLIRALFRYEPVHLLDGFLVFDLWREDKTPKNCWTTFRTMVTRAGYELERLRIKGVKIGHPSDERYCWELSSAGDDRLESNITDAVQKAKESCDRFLAADFRGGWGLIRKAYETWPDARSLCQALASVQSLPEDRAGYKECLTGVTGHLEDYKEKLLQALFKVMCLALEERQDITIELVNPVIDRWVGEFFQLRQALSMLSSWPVHKPVTPNERVAEFVELLNKCRDHLPYISGRAPTCNKPEVEASAREAEVFLKQLLQCDAMHTAAEDTIVYYEGQPNLAINTEAVYGCLQEAIVDFLERHKDLAANRNNVYVQFCADLRAFVGKFNKKQGIVNVLDSDKDAEEKKDQLRCILENMVSVDEGRDRIRQLFDIAAAHDEKQYAATAIPCQGVCPHGGLHYLQSIRDVLKIDVSGETPRWFRTEGPIEADIKDNRICRNKDKVSALKKHIIQHQMSMLEGLSGTGKTAFVRIAAYELYKDLGSKIFFFDCDKERNFSPRELAQAIKSTEGIFVIENIHLEPRKLGPLILDLQNISHQHIIFTSRFFLRRRHICPLMSWNL